MMVLCFRGVLENKWSGSGKRIFHCVCSGLLRAVLVAGSSHVSGSSSQPPAQQQATGLVSVSGNNGSSNIHRAATNPTFGSSGCTSLGSGAAGAAGYGSSGSATSAGRGSNSTRFSGAKSISSAQYFNQEDR